MSHSAISPSARSCPSGCAISSVTDRLLRFTPTKYALSLVFGIYGGANPRVSSPAPGRSILITSAPRSPSICTQVGPASTRVRSKTRRPFSGPVGSVMQLPPLARGSVPGPYSPPLISRPPATANRVAANRLEETAGDAGVQTFAGPRRKHRGSSLLDRGLSHPGGACHRLWRAPAGG